MNDADALVETLYSISKNSAAAAEMIAQTRGIETQVAAGVRAGINGSGLDEAIAGIRTTERGLLRLACWSPYAAAGLAALVLIILGAIGGAGWVGYSYAKKAAAIDLAEHLDAAEYGRAMTPAQRADAEWLAGLDPTVRSTLRQIGTLQLAELVEIGQSPQSPGLPWPCIANYTDKAFIDTASQVPIFTCTVRYRSK